MQTFRQILLSLYLCLLTGCAIPLLRGNPDIDIPVEVPEAFSQLGGDAKVASHWWTEFGDSNLDQLIATALSENLGVKAAWMRVAQSAAAADSVWGRQFPEIALSANKTRQQSRIFGGGSAGGQTLSDSAFISERMGPSGTVSYELDLWGKLYAQYKSAEADFAATSEDARAIEISLAASIADTWFSLIEQKAQLRLIKEQLKVSETFLKLVEFRFSEGLSNAVELYQQRQQVARTKTELPRVEARVQTLQYQLSVLLARAPQQLTEVVSAKLPLPESLPNLGVPADLIRARPDVLAAEQRVASADQQIVVAIAKRLPSLRISATGGYLSDTFSELFSSLVWSVSGDAALPLFDAGVRAAEVRRIRARREELILLYAETLLKAVQEVEEALVNEAKQKVFLDNLENLLLLSQGTLRESRRRYAAGLSDYLPVLNALTSTQDLQRQVLAAKRELISFRIQLYRALSQSWKSAPEKVGIYSARVIGEKERKSDQG